MAICPAPVDQGLVTSVVETVDCHIRALVHDSYRDLVGPDTWFAAAFTGLLTIYIALLGYQLLFGRGGLRVTELPFTVIKIGLILAFLTSWAAYQTVVFRGLFDGPAQLTATLLGPLARSGGPEGQSAFNGDLYLGLEAAFTRLSEAAALYGAQASPAANILQGGPMLGSGLLWLSAIMLLLTTLGVLVAAKIVLAFLLAVGPVFIGLFLFEATRGLFDGWLRMTLTFALTPLAVHVFGAVLLLVLQPFLDILDDNAARSIFDMGAVITIGLVITVFGLVMLFGLRATAGIASGFAGRPLRVDVGPNRRLGGPDIFAAPPAAERAEQIAARIAQIDRAPLAVGSAYGGGGGESRRVGEVADAVQAPASSAFGDRLGQAYNRAPRPAIRRGDG
jgi:type IV secretion system protein VirB6